MIATNDVRKKLLHAIHLKTDKMRHCRIGSTLEAAHAHIDDVGSMIWLHQVKYGGYSMASLPHNPSEQC